MNMTNQISLQSLWIEHTYTYETLICVLSDDDRVSSSLVDLLMCFSFGCLVVVVVLVGFSIKKNTFSWYRLQESTSVKFVLETYIFILIFLLHVLMLLPTFCFAN